MNKRMMLVGLMSVVLVGAAAVVTLAQEEKVTIDQVPAAVKATILKEAGGAKVQQIERETKDGKTVYEAEFVINGKKAEVKIAEDGALLGRKAEEADDDEDELPIGQVPDPARGALQKLAGGAAITKAERERKDDVVVYGAEWVVDGVQHEAEVTVEGVLVEMEETILAEQAPAAVGAVIAKHFGAGAKIVVAKKMVVVYQIETNGDGQKKELLVLPTGRILHDDDADEDSGNKSAHDDDDDD